MNISASMCEPNEANRISKIVQQMANDDVDQLDQTRFDLDLNIEL
jgi:hypothetical protein